MKKSFYTILILLGLNLNTPTCVRGSGAYLAKSALLFSSFYKFKKWCEHKEKAREEGYKGKNVTHLWEALKKKDEELVKSILTCNKNLDINKRLGKDKETVLMASACKEDPFLFYFILQYPNINLTIKNKIGEDISSYIIRNPQYNFIASLFKNPKTLKKLTDTFPCLLQEILSHRTRSFSKKLFESFYKKTFNNSSIRQTTFEAVDKKSFSLAIGYYERNELRGYIPNEVKKLIYKYTKDEEWTIYGANKHTGTKYDNEGYDKDNRDQYGINRYTSTRHGGEGYNTTILHHKDGCIIM